MSSHRYPAPALGQGRFRLLQVSKATGCTLECVLSEHGLDSPPRYMPVSYTWGPAEPPASTSPLSDVSSNDKLCIIVLNGQEWEVTPNLFDLLQELSSDPIFDSAYIWIDALCINQSDNEERANQVHLMGRIYSQGHAVTVWLGQANGHSSKVQSIISRLASIYSNEIYPSLSGKFQVSDNFGQLVSDESLTREDWIALEAFFYQSWFTRVWTIQEIALSDLVIVRWGHLNMDWLQLCAAGGFIATMSRERWTLSGTKLQLPYGVHLCSGIVCHYSAVQLTHVKLRPDAPSQEWVPADSPFSAAAVIDLLIRATGRNGASDPRDRVYAFVGIWEKVAKEYFNQKISIQADYNKTVQTVYTDFMTVLLRETNSLNYLSVAQCHVNTAKIEGLPSWVPDYSIQHANIPIITYASQHKPLESIDVCANMASRGLPRSKPGHQLFHIHGNELFMPTFFVWRSHTCRQYMVGYH
ncbi:heterokaryon incompatibility protein-domain-containing protein [Hypoxylon sp. FL1284]|nr:heterokaryon incompatibility protein-domain-containing protein [Hypoxylon sp. FL1284]